MAKQKARRGLRYSFRIISGRWRGRRLEFPDGTRVRPSPDRVRETLFNWLAAETSGARCADLFAGTGALGLEALSRGASHVTFVERDAALTRRIEAHLERLECHDGTVVTGDVSSWLRRATGPFDIVFVDAPFDQPGQRESALEGIARAGILAANARIYIECPASKDLPDVPADWQVLKSKRAGRVGYHLVGARIDEKDEEDEEPE